MVVFDYDRFSEMNEMIKKGAKEADALAMAKDYKKAEKQGKLIEAGSLSELI